MTLLSICIPTYERPDLLERSLGSVLAGPPAVASHVEVVVSDNSTGNDSGELARRMLASWPGPTRYEQHRPGLGMVGNFNACVELAGGDWILVLHDDDYLLPRGLASILTGLAHARAADRVLLFGVRVVNARGRLLRRQSFSRERSLAPAQALRRFLANSSFVRFPAIVVHREAYAKVGPFDAGLGPATDIDMWARLFGTFGVRLLPFSTTAYVVHPAAATEGMFTPELVETLSGIFDRVADHGVLSPEVVRERQRHWFHQFVLAGAFRRLRAGDRAGAGHVMRLFELPQIQRLGSSPRWAPIRAVFTALVGPVIPPPSQQA